jgi:Ni,Fe-hydrogenase III large subunit
MSKKTLIPIGPYHPLQEEPELFKLYCEGEIVKDIKWETGYNHRGIEKLSESKTYEQIFFLVERICGICSSSHPFALPMLWKRLLISNLQTGQNIFGQSLGSLKEFTAICYG